jgi:L-ascorbate metabolism protein UlaG (beta-lactamase superfamily)
MDLKRWAAVGAGGAFAAAMYRKRKAWADAPRIETLQLNDTGISPPAGRGVVSFIGTATTLIQYGGFTILTEPNFLHRGGHVRLGDAASSKRPTGPVLQFDELPAIDFVVLSHLHEDHFDREVARRLPMAIPILTTPQAAAALRRKGFWRSYGVDPWGAVEIRKGQRRMRLTAMPGTHGPMLVSKLLPDVMGSLLDFRGATGDEGDLRVYISGGTLVFRDLEEIPRRYPDINLALLQLGGARVLGLPASPDDEQGLRALEIVAPQMAIPILYSDYDASRPPLEGFRRAVERAGWQDRIRYLSPGDTFEFSPADLGVGRELSAFQRRA